MRTDLDPATLEQELKVTRDRLQATMEEYDTALEELKSGNEALVSVNEALLRSNADLRNLFESTQIATVFLDRFMAIRSYTPAVTAIFSLIPGDRGRPITDIAHQLEDVDLRADIRQVLDEHNAIERPARLRNGKTCHLMRILPYRTADSDIDGVVITFADVTAVAVAAEQQRLLVSELNHRVRNMLQVVIGLGNQTLRRSATLEDFEKAFMGRMQALARAYELLSRDGWHKVPMSELLRTQLSPFVPAGERYTAQGDDVVLTANAALAMGMVLYELATNATKYGALSVPGGRVNVSWKLDGKDGSNDELVLHWKESGGPPVKAPQHHGFGSELVERQLRYELNGKAAMDFSKDGLQVTLMVPAMNAVLGAGQGDNAGR